MNMTSTSGTIGLLAEDLTPISDRQPCKFDWGQGPGSWAVQVTSSHEFEVAAGGFLVAIYDDRDRLMLALPIVARPIDAGRVLVGPTF
jgi:hypothetical protein